MNYYHHCVIAQNVPSSHWSVMIGWGRETAAEVQVSLFLSVSPLQYSAPKLQAPWPSCVSACLVSSIQGDCWASSRFPRPQLQPGHSVLEWGWAVPGLGLFSSPRDHDLALPNGHVWNPLFHTWSLHTISQSFQVDGWNLRPVVLSCWEAEVIDYFWSWHISWNCFIWAAVFACFCVNWWMCVV